MMGFIAALMAGNDGNGHELWKAIRVASDKHAIQERSEHGDAIFEAIIDPVPSASAFQDVYADNGAVLTGVLFGYARFQRESLADILTRKTVEDVCRSRGEHFFNNYWGHYAGLFFDKSQGCLTALRDNSGGKPLFYSHFKDIGLFLFSDTFARLCSVIGSGLELDRKLLSHILTYVNSIPTRRTAFQNIRCLLPGECLSIDGSSGEVVSDLPWWRKVACESSLTDGLAVSLRGAVSAWASVSGKIALQLSGGLDSSGLLGITAQQGLTSNLHCINNFRPGGVTDERFYAELAAHHAGAELTSIDMTGLQYVRELPSRYRFCSRPHGKILFNDLDQVFDAQALDLGCETYWLGFGGDTLFMNFPGQSLVADAFQNEGIFAAARTTIDVALYEEQSVWRVLSDCLANLSECRSLVDWAECMRSGWVGEPVDLEDGDGGAFRLLDRCFAGTSAPGQRRRLYDSYFDMWATAEQRQFYTANGLNFVAPYYSEPVVLSSFRIPSHHMIKFGLNRYPQRELVRGVMPPSISERLTKGGGDDQVIRTLLSDADEIEAYLRGGYLMSLGIIKLEDTFMHRDKITADEAYKNFPFTNLVACEVWLTGHADVLRDGP